MAAAKKSYSITTPADAGIARGPGGRFVRTEAVPPSPIQEEQETNSAPDKWAPKIGQGSKSMHSETIPTPPADQPTVDGPRRSPMRVR